jgi:hypothetical protein
MKTSEKIVYEGDFDDELFITGNGTITNKEGVYKGEIKNGLKEGIGIMNYNNGEEYDGEWKLNKRNGIGKFKSSKELLYGEWKDNKFIKKIEKKEEVNTKQVKKEEKDKEEEEEEEEEEVDVFEKTLTFNNKSINVDKYFDESVDDEKENEKNKITFEIIKVKIIYFKILIENWTRR